METFIIIIVGALAFRGASSMVHSHLNKERQTVPYYFSGKAGFTIIKIYMFAAIPIAILNGYIMNGWSGLLVVSIGTWLGMLTVNMLLRFNPAIQFLLFGLINIVWTIYNLTHIF